VPTTFDYIIVGSGPAGSTVAHRLANQYADRKVLLIEAGTVPSIESFVSAHFSSVIDQKPLDLPF
jgi:choline dehydrogenase-like flavoprotein